MTDTKKYSRQILRRPGKFMWRVLKGFKRNQGLLLSGGVAYNSLLSIIPMLALILIGLSQFIEQEKLLEIIIKELELIVPGHAEKIAEEVGALFRYRQFVGIIGIGVMLFFSSMAFSMLESAMSVIFYHRIKTHRRHFLISAIIPYIYMILMGVGIVIITVIAGVLDSIEGETLTVFGKSFGFAWASGIGLYLVGLVGLILMLTSLYLVMPFGQITISHALLGGTTAAILWEITRHVLVWYFAKLSLVSVIYGSFATAVVILLSIEIASIILLLGAQVIAEFERATEELAQADRQKSETD
ncbi:MAG: YihY/virulence factor BrkB family protein [Desulfobacterales bacterium]|nr:YihY/virulence factor BrkB family protein [Desulfobacterales bacterium]